MTGGCSNAAAIVEHIAHHSEDLNRFILGSHIAAPAPGGAR